MIPPYISRVYVFVHFHWLYSLSSSLLSDWGVVARDIEARIAVHDPVAVAPFLTTDGQDVVELGMIAP